MIFPTSLPVVTFYLEGLNEYHELTVQNASTEFKFEYFYSREAISAKRRVKISGVRFDFSMSFNQTREHDKVRDFYQALYNEYTSGNSRVRLYLTEQSSIGNQTDYLQVAVGDMNAFFEYRNQVRRHYYQISFTGVFSEFGIGLAFIIDNDGNFVFNNEGRRIMTQLNPYA